MVMLVARMGPTVVHISLPPTNAATGLRFALFLVAMSAAIATTALS
jgi:hypothetical protein